jgi:hypothetical protein
LFIEGRRSQPSPVLGWVREQPNATYDGEKLRWQDKVRAGEPLVLQYRLGIEGDVPSGSNLNLPMLRRLLLILF